MSQPMSSPSAPPGAAWDAALREVAGRLTALVCAQRRLKLGLAGVALLLVLCLAPLPALAGTITVNGTTCSLANAITTANTGTNTGGATGLPNVTSAITIEGNGHTISRSISAVDLFRILLVTWKGNLTLQHATISGGSTADRGGGIENIGTLTVQSSTLSGNSATYGGGIENDSGTTTVQNSIVALQASGNDCIGTITSQGYNIESGMSCGFTATGDQQSVTHGNLILGSLADNGAPTQTRALGAGSVAIDKIPVTSCLGLTTDQRGQPRPVDFTSIGEAKCDIGAFERQSDDPTSVTLRALSATGAAPGGRLVGLAAALALGLGGLVVTRRRTR
jgi:hypothetical protein